MPYEHGVRIKENPTSLPIPAKSEAGVPVIFGTAPVNLAHQVGDEAEHPVAALCKVLNLLLSLYNAELGR